MDALDMVKPLVDEAVNAWKEHRAQLVAAKQRRVDPAKSPAVRESAARLDGACQVLSRMWQLLGMEQMTPAMARGVLAEQVRVSELPDGVEAEPRIVVL